MTFLNRYLRYTPIPVVLAITISYLWLDRPLALLFNRFASGASSHGWLSYSNAVFLTQFAYCMMLPLFLIYCYGHRHLDGYRYFSCLKLICLAIPYSFFIKTCLQFFFGRITARYHNSHVLLFVRNPDLYGFHWLQNGSFPSGHMTVLTAGLAAIVCFYRHMMWPAIILVAVLAGLLLVTNYHFLSDIIAGIYLGLTITLLLAYLNNCLTEKSQPKFISSH